MIYNRGLIAPLRKAHEPPSRPQVHASPLKGFRVQGNFLMSDAPLVEVWLGSLPHDPSALKIARQGRVYCSFPLSLEGLGLGV